MIRTGSSTSGWITISFVLFALPTDGCQSLASDANASGCD